MRSFLSLGVAVLVSGASAQEELLQVPSGQSLDRLDQLIEYQKNPTETWLVLRYLAPQIARVGGSVGYDAALTDMDALCEADGLAALAQSDEEIDQIVIVLLDQPLPRGETNPEVTQFISAYVPVDRSCEWL